MCCTFPGELLKGRGDHQQDTTLLEVLDLAFLVLLVPLFFNLEIETYLVLEAKNLDLVVLELCISSSVSRFSMT